MAATRCSRPSSGWDPIGPVLPSGYSGAASEPARPPDPPRLLRRANRVPASSLSPIFCSTRAASIFRPDRRQSPPLARRACQGWPRSRGHPPGLGLDWPEHGGEIWRSGGERAVSGSKPMVFVGYYTAANTSSTKARRECFERNRWTDPLTGRIMMTCHICQGRIDPARERWEAEHVRRRSLNTEDRDEPCNILPTHESCHEA